MDEGKPKVKPVRVLIHLSIESTFNKLITIITFRSDIHTDLNV